MNLIKVTPEEYHKLNPHISLEELVALRDKPDAECENCANPVWKLVDIGLCFSCTTGESDGSKDYELI